MWFNDKNSFVGKRVRTAADSRELLDLHRFLAESFAVRAESRDGSKKGHVKRVEMIVGVLVRAMLKNDYPDFTAEYADNIILASTLHDIGKIAVSDSILQKEELTEKESAALMEHCLKGRQILDEIAQKLGGGTYIEAAKRIAYSHHERWNGCGYPERLKGNEIPLEARVVAIAHAADALLAQEKLSLEEATVALREFAGVYYDPYLTDMLLTQGEEIMRIINIEK